MIKVLVKKLNPKAELPKYKTEGSSGMDLMALIEKPIKIKPQSSVLISTGLSDIDEIEDAVNTFYNNGNHQIGKDSNGKRAPKRGC